MAEPKWRQPPAGTTRWEHFPHGTDIGVRGRAPTKAGAFEQAALALTALITPPETVLPDTSIGITCDATDDGMLLVQWLNAIVYEMDARRMLFGAFDVDIDRYHLIGIAWGEPVDTVRHERTVEVKAATATGLRVEEQNGVWTAECVVDT